MHKHVKLIGLLLLGSISYHAQGQNKIGSTGNVGIGTTSPSEPLHVVGDARFERSSGGNNHLLIHSDAAGVYLTSDDPGTNQKHLYLQASPTVNGQTNRHIMFQAEKNATGNFLTRMVVRGDGKVGIGTTAPSTELHVQGIVTANGRFSIRSNDGNAAGIIETTDESTSLNGIRIYASRGGGKIVFATNGSGMNEKMRITNDGKVGIGTATPDSKLSVNGNIRAREIKLEATDWPDYVFEERYDLPDLIEVEDYIKANGHLKDIPSAKEVETNGVFLGEINAKLLKKIEELTLYTIEQEKKIDSLQTVSQRVAVLEDKLEKLEHLEKEIEQLKIMLKTAQ